MKWVKVTREFDPPEVDGELEWPDKLSNATETAENAYAVLVRVALATRTQIVNFSVAPKSVFAIYEVPDDQAAAFCGLIGDDTVMLVETVDESNTLYHLKS